MNMAEEHTYTLDLAGKAIKMLRVDSALVAAIGWDSATLRVEMQTGRVYDYADVPEHQVLSVLFAPSVGRAYSALIANLNLYPCTWVNDDRPCQMLGLVPGGTQ